MSARFTILVATALILESAHAAGPASSNSTKDSVPISAADLTIQTKYKLAPDEFDSIRGAYTLSDGRRLKVWTERHKLFAETNSRIFEILPDAENTFVSRDGALELRFQPAALTPTVTISEK